MKHMRAFTAIARSDGLVEGESRRSAPWWSIAKTVLAAAALRLVERGALDLDCAVDDRPFTLRHLLQHTSGLPDYCGPEYHRAVLSGAPAWSVAEMLARSKAESLLFAPGEGWSYSNIGYALIRRRIEQAAGCDLQSALEELIFQPFGMRQTRLALSKRDVAETCWGNPIGYDPRWVYHGLLIGPPADAAAFLQRLLVGDALSRGLLAEMRRERPLGGAIENRPWTKTGYGLGLMIGEMGGGGRALGHSGVGWDSVSSLYAFPELSGAPVVATFAAGTDEAVAEHEALRLAQAV